MEKITVNMFGNFHLKYKNILIDENFRQSNKIWILLEYLLYNKSRLSTEEEIIALLWPEGNNKNPINSLKNILFRLRNTLAEAGLKDAKKLIIYQNATISWNTDVQVICDFDEFNKLYELSLQKDLDNIELKEIILHAMNLYKKGFLCNRISHSWVRIANDYYASLYTTMAIRLIDIMDKQKDYSKMMEICSVATTVLPKVPRFNYGLILSNLMLGNTQRALSIYSEVKNVFLDSSDLGIQKQAQDLYQLILDSVIGSYEKNFDIIRESLENVDSKTGCLECPLEEFKSIYLLHIREKDRSGDVGYLLLLSLPSDFEKVNIKGTKIDIDELYKNPMIQNKEQGIEILKDAIRLSLRTGDVMTRYSGNQYLILMRNIYLSEDVEKVITRILEKTDTKLKKLGISLEVDYVKI